jgi:hypothetical protein
MDQHRDPAGKDEQLERILDMPFRELVPPEWAIREAEASLMADPTQDMTLEGLAWLIAISAFDYLYEEDGNHV